MTKQQERFVPLIVAISIVIGILVGTFSSALFSRGRLSVINSSSNKISDLFYLINDEYVDSVSIPDLVEKSLPTILQQLDPHSVYISKEDVEASMQNLEGSFSGVGVQFTIYKDTVRVVRVVKGGPSESAGIQAGDKIIAVNSKPFVGDTLTNDMVMKELKGPNGSNVKLDVLRAGKAQPLSFTISRGDVPVNSISAAYKLDSHTGYICISTFGKYTFSEFWSAMAKLNVQGFDNLVIDLRGNPGGYMQTAIQIANEFLAKDKLIVYTEGRKSPREDFYSDGRGAYQQLPLVILVDETSASSSEILAGALQDNDRATIIGRRTFGKGLVQVPIEFSDGSMLRLTRARYYTPSGRCVQRPYKMGEKEEYYADVFLREQNGELYNEDSIHLKGEKYKTTLGRTVYGGGGIMPDIFIPADTLGMTSYFREAYIGGYIYQFAYDYTDRHRKELAQYSDAKDLAHYLSGKYLPEAFAQYAADNGLKRRNVLLSQSYDLFKRFIISSIINDVLDEEATYIYQNQNDPIIKRALHIIESGNAFPSAEQKEAYTGSLHRPWNSFGYMATHPGMSNYAWNYSSNPLYLFDFVPCQTYQNRLYVLA